MVGSSIRGRGRSGSIRRSRATSPESTTPLPRTHPTTPLGGDRPLVTTLHFAAPSPLCPALRFEATPVFVDLSFVNLLGLRRYVPLVRPLVLAVASSFRALRSRPEAPQLSNLFLAIPPLAGTTILLHLRRWRTGDCRPSTVSDAHRFANFELRFHCSADCLPRSQGAADERRLLRHRVAWFKDEPVRSPTWRVSRSRAMASAREPAGLGTRSRARLRSPERRPLKGCTGLFSLQPGF